MKTSNRFMSFAVSGLLLLSMVATFAVMSNGGAAAATVPNNKIEYDMTELGAEFKLPFKLMDLGYKVRYIKGDQAPSTVEFTTKRLQAAGCTIDQAPMGMLTYRSDLGGTKIAHIRHSNMYYVKPDGSCHARPGIQDWKILRQALQNSLRSDD
jgi:hypothetical protein